MKKIVNNVWLVNNLSNLLMSGIKLLRSAIKKKILMISKIILKNKLGILDLDRCFYHQNFIRKLAIFDVPKKI